MHERAPQKHIGLYFLIWYGAINNSIGHWENLWTNYASERGASELGNFSHFHILKLLFPSIFCWYFWYFISKTHIFSGLKLHLHIQSMQFPVITYGMALYINDSYVYRQNTNIEENLCICERAERASLEFFSRIFTLIFTLLQILCRYTWHACRLTCSNKFRNVPTKLWKSIIGRGGGGGGGIAPLPSPPPPPGYANGWQCQGSRYMIWPAWFGAANLKI